MGTGAEGDRRRVPRYPATLNVSFQFARKRHVAITTNVCSRGAQLVAPVQLPPGGILVFQVEPNLGEFGEQTITSLVAQVVWTAPARFGGSSSFAAGLQLLRAADPSWERLVALVAQTHGDSHGPPQLAQARMTRAPVVSETSAGADESFDVLFHYDGVWYRGDLVVANQSTVWIRSPSIRPPLGAPIRLQVAVSEDGRRTTIGVGGRVPGYPIPDQESRGWVFEVEVHDVSHPGLFRRLVERLAPRGRLA